ncbi:MAG: hypothetical protein MR224_07655 [Dorea sp.]|nr:hypothetical protein [Dorea sp.]MDY2813704.1 hypothetical protein [Dorea sp.]
MDENNHMESEQSQSYEYQDNSNESQNRSTEYRDNFDYNSGNQANQQQVMDTSPLSMGDWILTILASFIPCAGIILYFFWAFNKNGNVNRRNFCRAQLIIMGAILIIYIVFLAIFGIAIIGEVSHY